MELEPPPEVQFTAVETTCPAAAERRRARSWSQLCDDLTSLSDELFEDLRMVTKDDGRMPALCAGWDVRDIVLHLVVGDDLAERSLLGYDCFPQPTHDEKTLQAQSRQRVAKARATDLSAAVDDFRRGRERLIDYLGGLLPAEQGEKVSWAARPISRFALVQSRLMETWIHGWDLRHPLARNTPFDDRAWWVADMGVRHVPYALAKEGVEVAAMALTFNLDGTGGGLWCREVGQTDAAAHTQPSPVLITGPSWAWVVAATRRRPGRSAALSALDVVPAEARAVLLGSARAFA